MRFLIKWKDRVNGINKRERWIPISGAKAKALVERAFPKKIADMISVWESMQHWGQTEAETDVWIIKREG